MVQYQLHQGNDDRSAQGLQQRRATLCAFVLRALAAGQVEEVMALWTVIKKSLSKRPVAARLNARLKCYQVKRTYRRLCSEVPGAERAAFQTELADRRWPWRVLFVGTDWEQDRSGIIQGLQSVVAEADLLESEPGKPGQLWPEDRSEVEPTRRR